MYRHINYFYNQVCIIDRKRVKDIHQAKGMGAADNQSYKTTKPKKCSDNIKVQFKIKRKNTAHNINI